MPRPSVLVRVVQGHEYERGDYHQWVTLGERVRADRLGRSSPRMYFTEWTKWICNSGRCAAWALVHDDAMVALIEDTPVDGYLRQSDSGITLSIVGASPEPCPPAG